MDNASQVILNKLLDMYESSSHLREPGKSNRRVLLNVSLGRFKEYDYENLDTRNQYNQALLELEKRSLLQVSWLNKSRIRWRKKYG